MVLDRRQCEDKTKILNPCPNYLGSNAHSAADINVKHILVLSSLFARILLVSHYLFHYTLCSHCGHILKSTCAPVIIMVGKIHKII